MLLTPNNRAELKVEKMSEIVEVDFHAGPIISREGSIQADGSCTRQVSRIYPDYALSWNLRANSTTSYFSSGVDAQPVVYAEDPVWTEVDDGSSSCILFVARTEQLSEQHG